MKLKIVLLLLLFSAFNSFAQKKDKNTDNYSYVKLLITNADNKVLLLKWGETWEIPGSRYNQPYSLLKFVDTLAKEDGISLKDIRLSGLFNFEYEDQKKLAIMMYYSASYSSGAIRVPAGCSDIRWFSMEEAQNILTFDDMKMIIKQISGSPSTVWGGTIYKRTDRKTNQPVISLKEPFFKLN